MGIGLDSFGTTFVAKDIKREITGLAVADIILREKLLEIRLTGRCKVNLRALLDPSLPLVCTSRDSRDSRRQGSEPYHVVRFEEHIRGGAIVDVSQIDLDRILLLTIEGEGRHRIYFELMPPFPNVFLTDHNDILIEPLFKAGTETRRRKLARGNPYVIPKVEGKIHPSDVEPSQIDELLWQRDSEILSKSLLGISPFVSCEIASRAKSSSLLAALEELLTAYREASIKPCLFEVSPQISPNPPHMGIAWFEPTIEGVRNIKHMDSMNEASRILLEKYLATTMVEQRRSQLLRIATRRMRSFEKMLAKVPSKEDEIATSDSYRKMGEILVANLSKIRKGATRVRLADIYDPDRGTVEIPLEPALSPQENVELYFKKARKAMRRAELAQRRRHELSERIAHVKTVIERLQQGELSKDDLQEIASMLEQTRPEKPEQAEEIDQRAQSLGIRPRRYTVSDGWSVLVGRSAKENDILTHKYARPSDLFFHARQAQGSHVILKRGNTRKEVSKQAIYEAAAIAAYYSKARTSKHVPVSYTEKRYVKKVRKGQPGLCTLLREKVIFVDPALPGH